jgi:hypothetical protein
MIVGRIPLICLIEPTEDKNPSHVQSAAISLSETR